MIHSQDDLKTRYNFSDFLFYICLLSVPFVTSVFSILKNSVWWTIAFIGLAIGVTALILRFYCTRCPHYTREGKILKCIFFWGLPKFFNKRPGKLDLVDKVVTFSATVVLLIFPLYWLWMEPGSCLRWFLPRSTSTSLMAGLYLNWPHASTLKPLYLFTARHSMMPASATGRSMPWR